MDKKYKYFVALGLILIALVSIFVNACTSGKYLLDQPVSDPIMSVDDNQSSDLARCEEGGVAGGSGSCPT
jgi:hypothetical protein